MSERDLENAERRLDELDEEVEDVKRHEEEADPGLIGGGGPASTLEPEDPKDQPHHLADTDHGER
ncbi:MAG: hypothetical protein M3168_00095 [Actinomycetota bacterium]|nr:hypothetical protein [Actinomycetota bacterium]